MAENVNEQHGLTVGYPIPRGAGGGRRHVESPLLTGTVTEQVKVAEGAGADLDGAVVSVGKVATESGAKNRPLETEAKAASTGKPARSTTTEK